MSKTPVPETGDSEPLSTSTPQIPKKQSSIVRNTTAQMDFYEEKDRLTQLNDRFAVYIDRVWQLEYENNRLQQEISTLKSLNESRSGEIMNVRSMVEAETVELRKLLDETLFQKAQTEIDMNRVWNEKEALQAKLLEIETESKRICSKLETTNKSLEKATLERVNLENMNKTLQEENMFLNSIFSQTQNSPRKTLHEIDQELASKYEAKLQRTVKELRVQCDKQYMASLQECKTAYKTHIEKLEVGLHEAEKVVIKSDINSKKTVNDLNLRIEQLERQLDAEQKSHRQDNENNSSEIIRITKDLQLQHQNYALLLEQKLALDNELVAYEQLLHGEESRFKLNPNEGSKVKRKLLNRSSTPHRRDQMEKRRRISADPQDFTLPPIFENPEISVSCPNPTSGMVIVRNIGKNSVNLGDWKIYQTDENNATVSFQFDKNFILEKGARIAVYSSTIKGTNTPKKLTKELFLNGANWSESNNSVFVLSNNFGNKVSTFTHSAQDDTKDSSTSSCRLM